MDEESKTGAYLRICRDGKYQPIGIDQLTDDELQECAKKYPEKGWFWAKFLAAWIRDNVKNEMP